MCYTKKKNKSSHHRNDTGHSVDITTISNTIAFFLKIALIIAIANGNGKGNVGDGNGGEAGS
jgi:hypothetical protein